MQFTNLVSKKILNIPLKEKNRFNEVEKMPLGAQMAKA
jgi:hypothetical protein